jgi:DNA helicase IV
LSTTRQQPRIFIARQGLADEAEGRILVCHWRLSCCIICSL